MAGWEWRCLCGGNIAAAELIAFSHDLLINQTDGMNALRHCVSFLTAIHLLEIRR